ncbi:tRNA (adenosine(37)-N6)-dimethylallyltransferase MiaA [bacterium]|nr:tRNA (adenosine(37)-N6)-dimethylallyltransferase MiaA [Akkermansiaceae bacterium]MDB4318466.1 tRNA (adenosine(37)-N6)-dimethylallyltransferase MiaA [bacterium]MDA7862716.1 tRNA (adenosine(37)-N6)-dimethylallyltransferase MiaA [Akkermansiaceae bacterium]MDA7863412.1 tRNA (adenosine(37)-N6)-dimethylallyltransferase MiaA [Akkermansiaceae bacterium]MDA8875835.1 tRNA (adenosine(37)-N6)-dimethylallyltransferase MiaA [Akkermansiaceae bacterium]
MHSPLYLCGTTASGKSTCAVALAEALDGEIVNADAFQIYRGLEVLSAAPTEEEKKCVPHHLYGTLSLEDPCDAARYESLASPLISDIQSRGKLPIIVGGSGLYLKFLTHGVSSAPPSDAKIRASLEKLSTEEIIHQLRQLDPEEEEKQTRQNSENHRHLSRALEICLITGAKASDLRKNFADPALTENLNGIVLTWPTDELSHRIDLRTAQMLQNGAIEEVQALPQNAATVRQAIGVKEIESYLSGALDLKGCLERIATCTRQYAKRQRNWFRRESWLQQVAPGTELSQIISLIRP